MDGGVYFVVDGIGLYALDAASGDLRWQYETEEEVRSLSVVDGVVYSLWGRDGDLDLYAVDAVSGFLQWRYAAARISLLSVVDGGVYFVRDGIGLYALDAASGGLRWQRETDEVVVVRSLSVVDGVVYSLWYRNGNLDLYAVDAVSGFLRRYSVGRIVGRISSLSVVDGVVYFVVDGIGLYALDAGLRWQYETDKGVRSLSVVDGVVYFVVDDYDDGYDAYLQAVDAVSGELRWEYRPECVGGSICYLWTAEDADGVVYVVYVVEDYEGDTAYLQAVDAASGELRWRYSPVGSEEISFLGVVDGVVYFESSNYTIDDGYGRYLYAVEGR